MIIFTNLQKKVAFHWSPNRKLRFFIYICVFNQRWELHILNLKYLSCYVEVEIFIMLCWSWNIYHVMLKLKYLSCYVEVEIFTMLRWSWNIYHVMLKLKYLPCYVEVEIFIMLCFVEIFIMLCWCLFAGLRWDS